MMLTFWRLALVQHSRDVCVHEHSPHYMNTTKHVEIKAILH